MSLLLTPMELSLDERSINGALLMELTDDDDDELADEDDELTIGGGGGFEGFPFDMIDFDVDELAASFSGFRNIFGDVWGLCMIFSPRVNVKLLLNACMDDSARLKSLS